METVLLLARVLLALIFLVAGMAKLADRGGSKQAVIDFGLPTRLAPLLGLVVPLTELGVAAALVSASTTWWGALAALALLLAFIVGIAINLARGRKPECRCFGQLHSAPAGWSTLIRNAVFAALAAFILWEGREGAGPSLVSWVGTLSAFETAFLVAALLMLGLLAGHWWLLAHMLRQNGRLLVRVEVLENAFAPGSPQTLTHSRNGGQPVEGLPVGSPAPPFNLSGLYGETLTLDALRAPGKPVMLFFTDPNCGPCNALLPQVGSWQDELAYKLSISLISRGTAEENRVKSSEHGLTSVLLQEDWEVSEAYEVTGTPSAVLIRPDGTIGSPVVAGSEAIRSLITRTGDVPPAQLPMQPQPGQGEPCPDCGKVHPRRRTSQNLI